MSEALVISKIECEILGLRVGRISCESSFNEEIVINHILENDLDILRIRIENPDRDIYSVLDKLQYRYYLLNISQVFEFSVGNVPEPLRLEELHFKDYVAESERAIMHDIVKRSFTKNDGSYYFNPRVAGKFSAVDELNSMAAYMTDQFHDGKSRWTKLVYYNDIVVGFVSYHLTEDIATGDLFGVLPEYQKNGIGREIGNYVLNELSKTKRVRNCVHIQQSASLNLHYSLGMRPTGIVLNFHIVTNF